MEKIIVMLIIIAAAGLMIKNFKRTLKGEACSDCQACNNCKRCSSKIETEVINMDDKN